MSRNTIFVLTEAALQSCHERWKIPEAMCVASKGYYFEGNKVDLDELRNK
jgi:hypothetical protein